VKLSVRATAGLELPAGKTDHIEFDDDIPGFGCRVREGGSKTLIFQYKLGNKQRRMVLGKLSALNFDDTRKTAKRLHAQVSLGHDPAADKAEAKSKAQDTFEAVAQDHIEWQRDRPRKNGTTGLKPRSVLELERHLLQLSKPLHKLRLGKISRADIAGCLDAVEKHNGPVARNRARSSLSGLFTWAMKKGRVESNPVALTDKNQEQERERVLKTSELKLIWNALDADQYSDIVRLLLLTGQRRAEIAGLCWSEVEGDTILLPLTRTKNGRPHSIPLSPLAAEIIARQPRRADSNGQPRDLIFGFGAGGFSGWSGCKERLDTAVTKAAGTPLADWRLHDLRRTAATGMADIDVPPHIIEAVLNHASGHRAGVHGVYNRSTYEPAKRDALNRWAAHVLAITEGGNIVALARPA